MINIIKTRFAFVVPALILWEIVALYSQSPLLPTFSSVFDAFVGNIFLTDANNPFGAPASVPVLLYHAGSSLVRVGAGFALAVLIGVPIGFLMGYIKWVNTNLDPIISTLRPIPPIAWIPLAILWFGLGLKPTIFIIFIGTLFPIILNTYHGVKSCPRRLIQFAQVLGASRFQVLSKVLVFEAFPSVVTGMRIGFGIGWMSVVAAEMIAAKSGLGYLIMTARWMFATEIVLAGMLLIGLIGFVGDILLRMFEKRFSKWREGLVLA